MSIASLPACSDGSTPLLIVSAQAECKNATVGTEAESEEVGTCLGLEGEKDIGSMGFVCYGDGTAGEKASKAGTSAAATGSTGAAVVAPAEKDTDDSDNNNTGSNDSIDCCCCCVVM